MGANYVAKPNDESRGRTSSTTNAAVFPYSVVSPMSDHFLTPRACQFAPSTRDASPSSSVDSAPLSWSASEDGDTDYTVSDFDDLYGVSEDEIERKRSVKRMIERRTHSIDKLAERESGEIPMVVIRRMESVSANNRKNRFPMLDIPVVDLHFTLKSTSIPPTPPPKIPLSPAVLSILQNDTPNSSATPSLDWSASSEAAAQFSGPGTPVLQAAGIVSPVRASRLQLNREALAALQSRPESELLQSSEPMMEIPASSRPYHDRDTIIPPAPRLSLVDLSELEIPSPGGFFASLNNSARHTWAPPSSTTAEQFYKAPWNIPTVQSVPVERTIDLPRDPHPSESTPRAIPDVIAVPADNIVTTELEIEYDPEYEGNLKVTASASLDRTCYWLQTQTTFFESLRDAIHPGIFGGQAPSRNSGTSKPTPPKPNPGSPKESVQFLDEVAQLVSQAETFGPESQDAIFWRAFQEMIHISNLRDALLYSQPRFDALQISRIVSPEKHCAELRGDYQANVATVTRDPEDAELLTVREMEDAERAREAENQMKDSAWNVTAAKILNGGSLLISPAPRLVARKPARVLDLGGQSVCDWAWHCAEEYPHSDVYTIVKEDARSAAYCNLRGPVNHRQIAVQQLYRLPFPDHFFEVISARSLYTMLKTTTVEGEARDEYDLCLKECLRCLKPGGYFEYSMLDSDLMNAGPLGMAMSVEFGSNLQTRGYDSGPTRGFLGRLKRAGFRDLKRSWIVLPMGTQSKGDRATEVWNGGRITAEDVVTGSTADAACLSCLVGSLAWEKWMLKLQREMGKEETRLLEGVSAVVQEGREVGAAWRCLSGWARKPLSLETTF